MPYYIKNISSLVHVYWCVNNNNKSIFCFSYIYIFYHFYPVNDFSRSSLYEESIEESMFLLIEWVVTPTNYQNSWKWYFRCINVSPPFSSAIMLYSLIISFKNGHILRVCSYKLLFEFGVEFGVKSGQ